jgi:hypothetical protein
MRIEVTNYGQNGYHTTQKVLLLQQLLQRGQQPDLVIFLDGVNKVRSCMDGPSHTAKLREVMHNLQFTNSSLFIGLLLDQLAVWLTIAAGNVHGEFHIEVEAGEFDHYIFQKPEGVVGVITVLA